jgi:adenylate kinase family enzyme
VPADEVHLVTGLPCCGKSTLSRHLAEALDGTAVVVGDLIRAARAGSRTVADMTQQAFAGLAEYPPEWLAGLVRDALRSAIPPVILDGAAPLDVVLPALGITVSSVLYLHAPAAVRRERFGQRRSGGTRPDDTPEVFEERTRFHAASATRIRSLVPAERFFCMHGERTVQHALGQALAAVVVARHVARRPASEQLAWPPEGEFSDWLARVATAAEHASRLVFAGNDQREDEQRHQPLLLLKPGHTITPALIRAVLSRFAAAGYSPAGVSVWPGGLIAESKLAEAHLELHYIHARWSHLLGNRPTGHVPAYALLAEGWPAEALSDWWHASPGPRRTARALWVKPGPGGRVIINGHIPALVDRWGRPAGKAVAIQLAGGAGAWSYEALRSEVLGDSDPATAAGSTLRGLANQGRLPIREPVTLAANLVHLSASPDDARRERWLWLGGPATAGDNPPCWSLPSDRPPPACCRGASDCRADEAAAAHG